MKVSEDRSRLAQAPFYEASSELATPACELGTRRDIAETDVVSGT
jgi:hypothetical protein